MFLHVCLLAREDIISNLGKEAKILLNMPEESDSIREGDEPDLRPTIREDVVSMLLICRPAYLLNLVHTSMVNPRSSDLSFVEFEDMKPGLSLLLYCIVKQLAEACQPKPGKDTSSDVPSASQLAQYVMAVEAQFAFGHSNAAKVEWPSMWAKILTATLNRGTKTVFPDVDAGKQTETTDKNPDKLTDKGKIDEIVAANLIKWLPPAKTVCPNLKAGSAWPFMDKSQGSPLQVKTEPNESTAAKPNAAGVAAVADASTAEQSLPSLTDIYGMHDLPNMQDKKIDVRDVVAIRAQIELYLLSHAK